ncbi:MAG: HAD family phosphatase [Acidimicrobiales bacterium]|jgi:HAD superfamily hydrolase (TIGR01509 family)
MSVSKGGISAGGDSGQAFDAVVFDLDGVVVDTERIVHEIWEEMFARYGCSFTLEEYSALVGSDHGFDPFAVLAERSLVPVPPLAELRSQIEQIEQLRVIGLSALPGVREWIESAERLGMGLAVASSSPLAWVQARLEDVRLDSHFTVMSCRGDQLAAKPEPDLYLDACRRLGVDPTRSIAVEDSANGLAAAHAAGLVCVAVPNTVTRSHDLSTAELLVESLAAVPFEEALRLLSEKRGL